MDVIEVKNTHIFKGEMEISTALYPEVCTHQSKRFSPLPDKNISFYFKACYGISNYDDDFDQAPSANSDTVFLLTLIKSSDSECFSSLVMSIEVSIYYSDGTLFKEYKPKSNIRVDHLDFLEFEMVSNKIYSKLTFMYSVHSRRMQHGNLTIRCRMSFIADISKTALRKSSTNLVSNFSHNLTCAYEAAAFTDFVFKVGDKSFPVHKFILAAHSPVFMTMLTQDFEESKTNSVTITDATPESFEMFLKYLYSGIIEDKSWASVKELYCLADKYDVGILKNDCVDIAIALLSIDLVCDILKLAYMYDDSVLKSAAKKFSVDHIKELLSRNDWKELVVLLPIIGYDVIVNFAPS